MSAPAQKTKGLPVSTIPAQSAPSSSSSRAASDCKASGPNTFGFCQSSPLSIVTSATGPASVSIRESLNSVGARQTRSQSSAAPMPIPTQSAVSPYCTSGRSFSPYASCAISRTPVAASG